ncbi:hypothetical protein CRG98_034651 [Punica granatum]|uniref:Uncharacterized protein n=1 Tax=Punica granatum TaxID=22663 RepID=A0A2I0INJ2_PUNGR|nr:hypothetical protein CRG98_034651 [Punica granatum]
MANIPPIRVVGDHRGGVDPSRGSSGDLDSSESRESLIWEFSQFRQVEPCSSLPPIPPPLNWCRWCPLWSSATPIRVVATRIEAYLSKSRRTPNLVILPILAGEASIPVTPHLFWVVGDHKPPFNFFF